MFNWIGSQAFDGFKKKALEEAAKWLGKFDLKAFVDKTPMLRAVPYFYGWWDTLSEEKKQEYASIIMAAAMKALANYAGK